MSKSPTTPSSQIDPAWKTLLDVYFPQLMAFFWPELHEQIDWEKGFESLDSELQAVTRQATIGKRLVDKLFQVHSKQGGPLRVLTQIEVVRRAKSHPGNEALSFQGILAPCSDVTGSLTLPRPRVSNKIGRMQGTKAGKGRVFTPLTCHGKRRRVNASERSSQFRDV